MGAQAAVKEEADVLRSLGLSDREIMYHLNIPQRSMSPFLSPLKNSPSILNNLGAHNR